MSPSTVDNGQINITQEIRLQSNDPSSRFVWTTGLFFTDNRQTYLEQIHDPMLSQLQNALIGDPNIEDVFGVGYVPPGLPGGFLLSANPRHG